jgi:hypothetical protein
VENGTGNSDRRSVQLDSVEEVYHAKDSRLFHVNGSFVRVRFSAYRAARCGNAGTGKTL